MKSVRVEKNPGLLSLLNEPASIPEREVLEETDFRRAIAMERRRSERSKEPFLLMLAEAGESPNPADSQRILECLTSLLLTSSRDTDVAGWYKQDSTLGVLFTTLMITDQDLIVTTIVRRISALLRDELTADQFNQVTLSFHFYPDDWDQSRPGSGSNSALYPDLLHPGRRKRSLLLVKRSIDLLASALGLIALSPLFLILAVAVKLTSPGPIFFRQQRVGQYGKAFTVFKFRSMVANNDASVHKEYVLKLIRKQAGTKPEERTGRGVYKLTNDNRITRLGRFLRRTSLDELPQIINVLKGDMSLVGPRPAIPYELSAYQTWHRRRILEAKPGITGLWQVTGRSLVQFDDMVRMDLRYATSWSLGLDLKILLMTPRAVAKGAGAF